MFPPSFTCVLQCAGRQFELLDFRSFDLDLSKFRYGYGKNKLVKGQLLLIEYSPGSVTDHEHLFCEGAFQLAVDVVDVVHAKSQ